MAKPPADPFVLAQHLAIIQLLSRVVAERRGEALPAMFGGEKAASITVPRASTYARETDRRQLIEWVQANFPEQIITTHSISDPFLRALKDSVKKYGGWLTVTDGAVTEVPGLKRVTSEGGGTPRVTLAAEKDQPVADTDAYRIIAAAHQRGEIDLSDTILAVQGPDARAIENSEENNE